MLKQSADYWVREPAVVSSRPDNLLGLDGRGYPLFGASGDREGTGVDEPARNRFNEQMDALVVICVQGKAVRLAELSDLYKASSADEAE